MSPKKEKLDTDKIAGEFSEELSFFQTSPQTDKTTKPQEVKPAKPDVEKYTTHLLPDTIQAIKVYAVLHKMKDYEVVQQAMDEYLERRKED